jgi:hypothetical protein
MDYVRSMISTSYLADPGDFVAAVIRNLRRGPAREIRIRTHSGCLIAA